MWDLVLTVKRGAPVHELHASSPAAETSWCAFLFAAQAFSVTAESKLT